MADYTISTEGYLSLGKESTFGTPVAASNYIPILSESIAPDSGGIFPDDIRDGRARYQVLEGPFGVAGDIEFQAGPENGLGEILFAAMGTCTQGTTSPYTHAYTPTAILPSYTLNINDGDAMVRQISGCKVGSLEIACSAGEPVTVTASIVGRNETIGTTLASSTFSTLELFKWSEGKVTVAGTVDANIESMSIRIDNSLVSDLRTLNESRQILALPEGRRVVTGAMDLNFTDIVQYRRFLGNATTPQITPWTDSLLFEWSPNSGTTYKLAITLSKVRFRTESVHISGSDRIVEGIEFDAIYDASSTADVLISLINTTASY